TKELVFYCDSDLPVGQACGCPILIATNISTCSRLYSKSLDGLPAGWIMFGFAILLAPGENRRVSEWDGGTAAWFESDLSLSASFARLARAANAGWYVRIRSRRVSNSLCARTNTS